MDRQQFEEEGGHVFVMIKENAEISAINFNVPRWERNLLGLVFIN